MESIHWPLERNCRLYYRLTVLHCVGTWWLLRWTRRGSRRHGVELCWEKLVASRLFC